MVPRFVICLLLAALLLTGCEQIPDPAELPEGDVAVLPMAADGEIPADWGHLVSVSNSADFAHIFQLWFEDDAGNVRIAFYNLRANTFQSEGRMIPRSEGGM